MTGLRVRAASIFLLIGGILLQGGKSSAAIAQPVSSFTLDDLVALIEKTQATTIDALLPQLPKDFRHNVTFVEHSRSLQSGDPMSPRAILWDEKGGMALSFNGGRDGQSGANTLEILQADPKTDRLHYFEIAFPLKPESDGRIHARPNERRACLQCHGTDPRPVWEEYPTWPSVYGSQDDFSPGPQGKGYQAFIDVARKDPRFQQTLPAENDPEWHAPFPYRPDLIARGSRPSTGFAYRPNLRLGNFLLRLNAHRLFRIIRENPAYLARRESLVRGLMNCGGPKEHKAPPAILAEFGLGPKDFDIRYRYDDPKNAELDFGLSYFDGTATINEYLVALLLEDITRGDSTRASQYGLDTLMVKYTADTPRNRFDWPLLEVLDAQGKWFPLPYISSPLTRALQKRVPFMASTAAQYNRVCTMLKGEDRDVVPTQPAPAPAQSVAVAGAAFVANRCLECHTAENHKLDLTDEKALVARIQSNPEAFIRTVTLRTNPTAPVSYRMPFREEPLSADERQLVIDYFKSLAAGAR